MIVTAPLCACADPTPLPPSSATRRFVALYASLSTARALAARDALAQERSIYARTTKTTYRNGVISALAQLKRRPPAGTEADAGTLEQDNERKKRAEEEEKTRLTAGRVEKYLASGKELETYGYVVEVPEGAGGNQETEEGRVRKCDRCGVEYLVHADLTEADKVVCSYHYGRQVMEKIKGKQRMLEIVQVTIGADVGYVGCRYQASRVVMLSCARGVALSTRAACIQGKHQTYRDLVRTSDWNHSCAAG